MRKIIYLLTKNPWKILAAKKSFSKYNLELKMLDEKYEEIQADTSLEIARHAAVSVSKKLKLPVIREDHSLFINELGFPGPYTKYIESRLSAEKLITLLKEDRKGYFEIAAVYAEPNGLIKEFVFRVPIKISKVIRGTRGNWNRVLMLENSSKTFAESTEEENLDVWNKNFEEIAKFLIQKNEKENTIIYFT